MDITLSKQQVRDNYVADPVNITSQLQRKAK